jgi:hypothetical protein
MKKQPCDLDAFTSIGDIVFPLLITRSLPRANSYTARQYSNAVSIPGRHPDRDRNIANDNNCCTIIQQGSYIYKIDETNTTLRIYWCDVRTDEDEYELQYSVYLVEYSPLLFAAW